MRKEVIGECELYLGDCLEVMPTLDPVSHVICDPPYEAITQNKIGGIKRNDGGKETEKIFFQPIDGIRLASFNEINRICSGWSVIFCTPEGVGKWADAINESTAKYKKACVWIKPDAMPQLNGQCPASGCEMFVASWHSSCASKWNAGGKRGVYTHNTNQPDRTGFHPTEKPIPLMMEIIKDFTNPGEKILDPFMGSGTTGVACVKLGRKFIGIEMNEKYFDLSCKRIEEAYRQPDMFIAPPPKPVQDKLI